MCRKDSCCWLLYGRRKGLYRTFRFFIALLYIISGMGEYEKARALIRCVRHETFSYTPMMHLTAHCACRGGVWWLLCGNVAFSGVVGDFLKCRRPSALKFQRDHRSNFFNVGDPKSAIFERPPTYSARKFREISKNARRAVGATQGETRGNRFFPRPLFIDL